MEALIIIPIIVFVIVMTVFGYMQAERRREELTAWCNLEGWDFSPDKDKYFADQYPNLKPLHQGHSRCARNRIMGRWQGRDFIAFDYHYVTGHGKNQQSHNFTVVILSSTVPLKPLFIRPEGFFDKIIEFFGVDDIDFESAEFSREFYVTAPDKKWAYDVLHPRMMEFLMVSPRLKLQFDCCQAVAFGRHGSLYGRPEYEDALRLLAGMLDRLPEYLVRQQMEAVRA